jgi:hypothetical protein
MPETRTIPEFKSEAEEAAWWDSHEEESISAFETAAEEGCLTRGTLVRRMGLPATTLSLDPNDIEAEAKKA